MRRKRLYLRIFHGKGEKPAFLIGAGNNCATDTKGLAGVLGGLEDDCRMGIINVTMLNQCH